MLGNVTTGRCVQCTNIAPLDVRRHLLGPCAGLMLTAKCIDAGSCVQRAVILCWSISKGDFALQQLTWENSGRMVTPAWPPTTGTSTSATSRFAFAA